MLSTKSLISTISGVPTVWILEHYCKLTEKLIGQDVAIKSMFNSKDKIPSMRIYFKEGHYKFKDFSTGIGGSGVDLVMELFKLNYGAANLKIVEDYNDFLLNVGDYSIGEFKVHSRYKITDFCTRSWNILDRDYWMSYGIGSPLLESYGVYPLSFYKMERDGEGPKKELNISGNYIYGYFRSDKTLYKVYQPKIRDKKFLNVKDHIQGLEQLNYRCSNLLIGSSMKDILCFKQFNWPFEVVAPASENTMIKRDVMGSWKHKYNLIVVLFDNDSAGVAAAKKYQLEYKIPNIFLPMEKDLSDSVQKEGVYKVKEILHPQLKDLIKCTVSSTKLKIKSPESGIAEKKLIITQ